MCLTGCSRRSRAKQEVLQVTSICCRLRSVFGMVCDLSRPASNFLSIGRARNPPLYRSILGPFVALLPVHETKKHTPVMLNSSLLLCTEECQVRRVTVAASLQLQDVLSGAGGHLIVVKHVPVVAAGAHPAHVVPRVCRAPLVRHHGK